MVDIPPQDQRPEGAIKGQSPLFNILITKGFTIKLFLITIVETAQKATFPLLKKPAKCAEVLQL